MKLWTSFKFNLQPSSHFEENFLSQNKRRMLFIIAAGCGCIFGTSELEAPDEWWMIVASQNLIWILLLQNNVTVSPAGAIVTTTNNSSNGNNGFAAPLFTSSAVLTAVPSPPAPALPQQPQPKVEVKPINEEMMGRWDSNAFSTLLSKKSRCIKTRHKSCLELDCKQRVWTRHRSRQRFWWRSRMSRRNCSSTTWLRWRTPPNESSNCLRDPFLKKRVPFLG